MLRYTLYLLSHILLAFAARISDWIKNEKDAESDSSEHSRSSK